MIRCGRNGRGALGEVIVVMGIPNLQGKQNDTYWITLEKENVGDAFLEASDLILKAVNGEGPKTIKVPRRYSYVGIVGQ